MPSPRGVSAIGVTTALATSAPSTPTPPVGGACLRWRYRWIPRHRQRIGGDWVMPFSWGSQGQDLE